RSGPGSSEGASWPRRGTRAGVGCNDPASPSADPRSAAARHQPEERDRDPPFAAPRRCERAAALDLEGGRFDAASVRGADETAGAFAARGAAVDTDASGGAAIGGAGGGAAVRMGENVAF